MNVADGLAIFYLTGAILLLIAVLLVLPTLIEKANKKK